MSEIYKFVEFAREKEFEALGWEYAFPADPPLTSIGSFFIWVHSSEPQLPPTDIVNVVNTSAWD